MLCQSVKNNRSTRDLSLCSANQWKATHPPWGCNLRSNAETYLCALPISEKQHIHSEDATRDQMQRLIFMLCHSVKSNTSNLRMQIKIFFHWSSKELERELEREFERELKESLGGSLKVIFWEFYGEIVVERCCVCVRQNQNFWT